MKHIATEKAAYPDCYAKVIKFEADAPDDFEAAIERVAGPVHVQPLNRSLFHTEVKLVKLPRLGIFSIRTNSMRVSVCDPLGLLKLTIPLTGRLTSPDQGAGGPLTSGLAHIGNLGRPFVLRTVDGFHALVVNFDADLIRSYRAKLNGGAVSRELTFCPRLSLTTPSGASLWRYLSFLWSELGHASNPMRSPLIAREIEDSLLAMFLYASEPEAQKEEKSRVADIGSLCLRRAEEYILAHLLEPLSLADIAEASEVNARTVSRAFKKHWGISPMAFLKERRLELAQRALLAADPKSTTVTEIATKLGFFHLGQFSKDYRKAFQELPSETLRH